MSDDLETRIKNTPLALFTATAFTDAALTYYNVGQYGTEFEGNPLIRHAMENSVHPIPVLLMAKATSCLLTMSVAYYVANQGHPKAANRLLYAGSVVWGLASLINLYYL